MVYETFVSEITHALQDTLGSEGTAEIHHVTKNNGVLMTGLCVCRQELPISPTIYLEPYYEQYEHGESLENIIGDILSLCCFVPEPLLNSVRDLQDFEKIKDKIVFRLIHASSNLKLLKDIPFIPYLDLAIIFSVTLKEHISGLYSTLVHNEHMKQWNVDTDTLMQYARQNTPVLFPPCLRPMREVIKDFAKQNWGNEFEEAVIDRLLDMREMSSPLYVLSNISCTNGACCILYDHIIKDFADQMESDLILLPSSIHEVLLAPAGEGSSYDELSDMVTEINQSDVPPEDRLSNQVYLYSRARDCISIASSAPEYITQC